MAYGPITSWQIDGEKVETVTDFIFLGSKITADGDCIHEIKRHLLLGWEAMTNLDNVLKSRDITLPTKVRIVKALIFPVVMYGWLWELDHGCVQELMPSNHGAEKDSTESPFDSREIILVNTKGDQPWIGRTDAEAEAPILWPPDGKNWLIRKDWRWERLKAGRVGDDR